MYTLKITDENTVVTTVKESIVERSNYVDKIQIVTNKMYREQIDMSDTTVYMKYKLPVSDKIKMTQLIINNLEYEQNYIQYLIPVDAALTAEAGDIEVSFTFLKLVANEDGCVEFLNNCYNSIVELQREYINATPVNKAVIKRTLEQKWSELDIYCYRLYDLTEEEIAKINGIGRTVSRIDLLNGAN